MIDRESSNLRRMRRYTDPFEDEGGASEREGYVKWLGLWVQERTLFGAGFGIAGLMLALIIARALLVGRVAWLPAGVLWFEIGFLAGIMVMSFLSCSMFVCGSIALRKQIRHMNAQMARWDDATPEEVEEIVRAADRRINRRVFVAHRGLGCCYRRAVRDLRDHFAVSLGRCACLRGEHCSVRSTQFRVELEGSPDIFLCN